MSVDAVFNHAFYDIGFWLRPTSYAFQYRVKTNFRWRERSHSLRVFTVFAPRVSVWARRREHPPSRRASPARRRRRPAGLLRGPGDPARSRSQRGSHPNNADHKHEDPKLVPAPPHFFPRSAPKPTAAQRRGGRAGCGRAHARGGLSGGQGRAPAGSARAPAAGAAAPPGQEPRRAAAGGAGALPAGAGGVPGPARRPPAFPFPFPLLPRLPACR